MSRDTRGGRRDIAIAVLLVALSLVFVSPIFRSLSNLGGLDWDANLSMHEVPRRTILEYGQIPLWNPYEWGGIPMLGSPWSRFLSPTFAVILAFGTVVGSKLDVWIHLVVGLFGTFVLARECRMGRLAAFTAACAYFFGGWFSTTFASGMSVFLGTAFLPWALAAHRRARRDARFAVALGAISTLVLFDGAPEPLAMLVVALALREAVDLVTRSTTPRKTLVTALVSGATFVGLSAVKLFPALELISHRQRLPRAVGGYSVESLGLALVERGQTLLTEFPAGAGFWRGTSWGMDETGAYVGFGVLALAAFGLFTVRRREQAIVVSLLFFVWTAFGERAPFGPWRLLHALPPFSVMRVPERFRFVFLLDLAIFAGFGLDALRVRLSQSVLRVSPASNRARASAAVLAGLVVLDLISTNRGALADAFLVPPVSRPKSDRFVQIRRLPRYDERGFLEHGEQPSPLAPSSSLYPAVVAGLGTARGFEPLTPRTGLRVRVRGDDGYASEEWLEGTSGSVTLARWSPNALLFDVEATGRGLLVVNQAYQPGWRARSGEQPTGNGTLLAVPVSAGKHRVELAYRPTSFVSGFVVSVVALAAVCGWFWKRGRYSASARVSTDFTNATGAR